MPTFTVGGKHAMRSLVSGSIAVQFYKHPVPSTQFRTSCPENMSVNTTDA